MSEKMELAEAGLRHADGLTAQLDRPHWVPSRAHIEQARNSIKKLAEMILTSSPAQEPVSTEPVEQDGPCFYCGEVTSSFAGNPGMWPLIFAQPDGTGIARIHHVRCVTDRLAIPAPPQPGREVLRKLVDIVWNEATESKAVPSTKWADRLIDRALTRDPK